VKNKLLVEKLKNEILKQTDLYVNVCGNILSDVSDIGEIYSSAQLIGHPKNLFKIWLKKFSLPYQITMFLHS